MRVSKTFPIIGWWSAGARSAVANKILTELFPLEYIRFVFINTKNEADDLYTFKGQCEQWYDKEIEEICSTEYDSIEDIWYDNMTLGLSKGAKCSEVLKIRVRKQFCKRNHFSHNSFGYDIDEIGRATDMNKSNAYLKPIYPLLLKGLDKFDCIKTIQKANDMFLHIEVPLTYRLGLENNNCFQTGCVKGGIGYWQWMRDNQPQKFDNMARREHEITDLKKSPVTVCKDQSNEAKASNNGKSKLIFLKPNPKYPDYKDISMIEGRAPEKLMDCNGFCSTEVDEDI